MLQYDDPKCDEIDEQLDRELFKVMFKQEAPDDLNWVKKAMGRAMEKALELEEEKNQMPSRKTFEEWIQLGEECCK